jgi:hypothetical protein
MHEAQQHLQPEDWDALAFYQAVDDQIINQAPMGTQDKKPCTTLRLEALEAACRLHGVPRAARSRAVLLARFLHDAREGRQKAVSHEAARSDPADLAPPEMPHG